MREFRIHFARVRPVQPMRRALDRDQLAPLHDFRGALARDGEGHDAIRIAVYDQRGHIDACEVVAEVRRGERGDAIERSLWRSARRDVPTELYDLVAHERAAQLVDVEEVREELGQKRRAVCEDT